MMLAFFGLGFTHMFSGSAGSFDRATAGQPSLIKFKKMICKASNGTGNAQMIETDK
jgi:hypothetical protein